MATPGSGSPVSASVTFPETCTCAHPKRGNSIRYNRASGMVECCFFITDDLVCIGNITPMEAMGAIYHRKVTIFVKSVKTLPIYCQIVSDQGRIMRFLKQTGYKVLGFFEMSWACALMSECSYKCCRLRLFYVTLTRCKFYLV